MKQLKTILVVDDEDGIRMVLCESLRRYGYTLIEAASGPEALALSRHQPIDVLVTDVTMPGMTGLELAAKLSAARPSLKVMLISGFCASPAALKQGWEFLQKPFAPSTLSEKLEQMCAAA